MRLPVCLFFLGLAPKLAFGQAAADSLATLDATERLLDVSESESSEQIERLVWLQEHPFDLNTVSKEELATIPEVTSEHAAAIINLRKRLRSFTSVAQLSMIDLIGEEVLRGISPYVFVEVDESRPSLNVKSRVVRDLQPRRGFQDSSFRGSPMKNYSRVTFVQPNGLQIGLLVDKDAGEKMSDGFFSGHLAMDNLPGFSRAVLGDYVVEAGQGLVFWRATAFGKGSEAVSVAKRTGLGIEPHRSTDEFHFFRGLAATSGITVGSDVLRITGLYSKRTLSATPGDSALSSFYEEGLFRTDSELKKKSKVTETIVGGRMQFRSSQDWNIGASAYHSSFDKLIVGSRTFDFAGLSKGVVGIDGEVNLGWLSPELSQIMLYAEVAQSGDAATAMIVGSTLNFARSARAALVYRDYSPKFVALHATGFGEKGDTRNERGLYVGVDLRPAQWLRLNAYIDHFRFPWRTVDNPLPTSGRDFLFHADAQATRAFAASVRYSNTIMETTEPGEDNFGRETRVLTNRSQHKLRFTTAFQASPTVRVRGRIEATTVSYPSQKKSERGFLVFQELQYTLAANLNAEARLIFFDTDSFDARVYEYENDLRGVFANPPLFGKGRRWYLLVRSKVMSALAISAKYSETSYEGSTSISSGPMTISGNLDNRFSAQIEVRF